MTHIARIASVARIAIATIGVAGPAAAQDWIGPRVVGTGENGSLEYPTPSANIVGGALVRVTGSGEGATVEVLEVQHAMPGRLSRVTGSGESAEIVVVEPASRGVFAVGRAAR
jgi:hypothetical protein